MNAQEEAKRIVDQLRRDLKSGESIDPMLSAESRIVESLEVRDALIRDCADLLEVFGTTDVDSMNAYRRSVRILEKLKEKGYE